MPALRLYETGVSGFRACRQVRTTQRPLKGPSRRHYGMPKHMEASSGTSSPHSDKDSWRRDDVASLNTVPQRRGEEHKTDLDDGGWWKQLRSSDEPARDDDNDADARNSHTTAGFSETDFLLYTKRHILTRKGLMLICRWSVGNTSYFYYQSIQRNNLEINYLSGIRWYRQ